MKIKSIEPDKYPLWQFLSEADRQKLIEYQMQHFGTKLDITLPPFKFQIEPIKIKGRIEPLEELEKLMRQKPREGEGM